MESGAEAIKNSRRKEWDTVEVVFALVILKLDVETVFDTYFHLDAVVNLRGRAGRTHAHIHRTSAGKKAHISEQKRRE